MSYFNHIPKGSELYDGEKFLAITKKGFKEGYIPKPKDYEPELKKGMVVKKAIFKFNGLTIYIHPNFV